MKESVLLFASYRLYISGGNEICMLQRLKDKFINSKEIKNASWIIAGRVIQMVLSFFVSVLTARYLGPGNYGVINYAAAYIAFFTSLCTLGINSVIIKDFVDHQDEQGEAIGTSLLLRGVSSLLSAFMIVGIVSIIDEGEKITIVVAALQSIALLFQVTDTFNYWFQSRYQSKITSLATLIAYVMASAYRIVLLALGKSIIWFALANAVDYICMAIVLLIAYKKYNGPKLSFSWVKGKSLLRSSYNYILSGMMVAIYGQTDKFMLKQMMNETSVGYYSLASSINQMWVFILTAIIDSMYPTILSLYSRGDEKQFERKNRQLYAVVIFISVFVAIMFMIFGEFLIRLLYGDAYSPALEPLNIIVWYTVFSYLSVARNAWVVCKNNQKYLKYMYCSAAVLNVFLNWIMIPVWGTSGAALASLITQIFTSLLLPCIWKDMRPNVKLMLDAFRLKGIR